MMVMTALPTQCSTALKEWATVLEAMARGAQHVLIRKGGLIEPGSGFEVQASTFLFYPTFEHQAINYLRPQYRGSFDEALRRRAPEGQVRFELCGVAISSASSHDPQIVERLSAHHIYNDAFLSQRLKWQPEQPLTIVLVRAFRLASPVTIPVLPAYAGCKSWVDLGSSISLQGAIPVLSDAQFQPIAQDIQALLS